MFAALVVLAGWILDIGYLKSVIPGFPQMKPNTPILFAAAAVSITMGLGVEHSVTRKRIALWSAFFVWLLGTITVGEYLAGVSVGSDRFFFPGTASSGELFSGHMSPHTAFCFAVIGLALILRNFSAVAQRISEYLTFVVILASFASLLGYFYDAEHMYGVSRANSMALHTIVLFSLLAVALLASNPSSRIAELIVSDSLGGAAARRLVPAVIIVPTLLGWLKLVGLRQGYFDAGFGATIAIFASVVLMFGIVLFFSRKVHSADLSRKSVENELLAREQQYRDLFDYSQGMICIHDVQGTLAKVNPAVLTKLGYSADEMIGRKIIDFLPDEHKPDLSGFFRQIENEGLANGFLPVLTKDGKRLTWSYHSILVTEEGQEPYVIGHAQDVTELLEAQRQLKSLSLTDDLTGLYNRRGFLTMAEQQIKLERHERTARGLTLMFADMDGLKAINDEHGHQAGSEAIVQLSKILTGALRGADIVARWGGDEFVMLTIGSHDDDADAMKTRIANRLAEYNARNEMPFEIECSVGVAPIPLDEDKTFESIIAEADRAMYVEKRRRKELGEISLRGEVDRPPMPPSSIDLQPNSRV